MPLVAEATHEQAALKGQWQMPGCFQEHVPTRSHVPMDYALGKGRLH